MRMSLCAPSPGEDVREHVQGALDGVDPVLQVGDALVHDVLAAVDVGQDLVDVVLRLGHVCDGVGVVHQLPLVHLHLAQAACAHKKGPVCLMRQINETN